MSTPTEATQRLMSFLKDQEGKVIWFLLKDGFLQGTLEDAPKDPDDEFMLINASLHVPNGEKQVYERVFIAVNQIYGWGGVPIDFLDTNS